MEAGQHRLVTRGRNLYPRSVPDFIVVVLEVLNRTVKSFLRFLV